MRRWLLILPLLTASTMVTAKDKVSSVSSNAVSNVVRGKVVKADAKRLYVQERDRVVTLELSNKTQHSGTSAALIPGAEVRAQFTLDQTRNIATEVEVLKPAARSSQAPAESAERSSATESDLNLRNPSLVPDIGETKGAGSPLPMPPQ